MKDNLKTVLRDQILLLTFPVKIKAVPYRQLNNKSGGKQSVCLWNNNYSISQTKQTIESQ